MPHRISEQIIKHYIINPVPATVIGQLQYRLPVPVPDLIPGPPVTMGRIRNIEHPNRVSCNRTVTRAGCDGTIQLQPIKAIRTRIAIAEQNYSSSLYNWLGQVGTVTLIQLVELDKILPVQYHVPAVRNRISVRPQGVRCPSFRHFALINSSIKKA